MSDTVLSTPAPRNIWMRVLMMLLSCVAFHVAAWLLIMVALVQLVFAIFNDAPNARLQGFGRSLGRYMAQIAHFVTFATDDLPFPFSDWPSGEPG